MSLSYSTVYQGYNSWKNTTESQTLILEIQSYKHLLHKIDTRNFLENTEKFETALKNLKQVKFAGEL